MFDRIVSILILLSLAIFGFRSLHLFASSNGLLTHLERCITNGMTPGGKPLRTLTTNGRFPRVDLQLRAVAVFLLIFCENLKNPDADVVGFSFAANWGASWILIVLESLREYSRTRFMSWITVPGILIFNQSNAVFTPLYLAIRLAFASPSFSPDALMISSTDLRAIPWSFLLGYVVPLLAMAVPSISTKRINTKHVIASWYQQWNLYISLAHTALVLLWTYREVPHTGFTKNEELLNSLRPVYLFTMAFAAASLWVPVIASALARIFGTQNSQKLSIKSTFFPPSPWSKAKCVSVFEGGKWLLQWDGIIGSMGSAVWALASFTNTQALLAPELPLKAIVGKTVSYMVLGGPMAVATGFLWERDALVLSGRATSLI